MPPVSGDWTCWGEGKEHTRKSTLINEMLSPECGGPSNKREAIRRFRALQVNRSSYKDGRRSLLECRFFKCFSSWLVTQNSCSNYRSIDWTLMTYTILLCDPAKLVEIFSILLQTICRIERNAKWREDGYNFVTGVAALLSVRTPESSDIVLARWI